jgi:hypothetical protein
MTPAGIHCARLTLCFTYTTFGGWNVARRTDVVRPSGRLDRVTGGRGRIEMDPHEVGRRRRNRTSPDRVQRSFYLSREVVDRARAAVHATASEPGEAHNMSELAGRMLLAEVRRLEERYNAGQPFPPVDSVRPGPGPAGIERIRNGVVVRRGRPHS